MTFPADAQKRSPKGDHNRRLALGIEHDDFAAEAGISPEDLRKYELTSPDQDFDLFIAQRVGHTLERLEATMPHKVDNGPPPHGTAPV
jgi:hypothetical protein